MPCKCINVSPCPFINILTISNQIVLSLKNIDDVVDHEDQAVLLSSLPRAYENFVDITTSIFFISSRQRTKKKNNLVLVIHRNIIIFQAKNNLVEIINMFMNGLTFLHLHGI